MTEVNHLTEQDKEYRNWLIAAEQKSQESFDKTVLALSGGALGISFVFLKDVVGPKSIDSPNLLLGAWITWALSSFSILLSYYLSQLALRHAIKCVDDNNINTVNPGGEFAKWTASLNASGAILFFVGVCLITLFAKFNLSSGETKDDRKKTTSTAAEALHTDAPETTRAPAANSIKRQSPPAHGGIHSAPAAAPSAKK